MAASLIQNTAAYPWSSVVRLVVTFPNGQQTLGSGVIVDRNDVLTASHIVYDANRGGRATSIEVAPGANGDLRPFGTYRPSEITYHNPELDNKPSITNAEIATDIALLGFSVEIGSRAGGWMGITALGTNNAANVTGYSGLTPAGTRDGTHMWSDSGAVSNIGDGVIRMSNTHVVGGNSGGPLWIDADPGPGVSPFVVGIMAVSFLNPTTGMPEGSADASSTSSDNPHFGHLLPKLRSDDALLSGRLFDAPFYLASNPDVRAAPVDSRAHYMAHGWREGRDPNAWFDTDGYLAVYRDVRAAGVNPLEHYRLSGWSEGRDPSTAFDTGSYLAAYADVRAAGINPLDHYLRFGQAEGRSTFSDGTWL